MKACSFKANVFALSLVLLLSLTGCEVVNGLKEYFFKSDKTKSSQSDQTPSKTPATAPSASGDTLASVGGWSISVKDFESRLAALKEVVPDYDTEDPEARRLVLDELVRQQLMVEDAEKSGLAQDNDIIAAVEEFRRTLIVRETARRLIEKINVTDEEIKAFYEEKKDLLVDELQWRVREIVVDNETQAGQIRGDIIGGQDFSQMAELHSQSESASSGGDLGYIADVPFIEMADVLLSLSVGDVSNVFEGPDGFYIIKLVEKKGGRQIPFEDLKEDIRANRMIFKQQQMILDYVEELQDRFPVEINESRL